MRNFELHRIEDASGVSGTGVVAEGVEFGDGTCALRWKTANRSTAIYENLAMLERIHGHEGKTVVRFIGAAFQRGWLAAMQDAFEGVPLASVGGAPQRRSMVAPEYVPAADRIEYLDGYAAAVAQGRT